MTTGPLRCVVCKRMKPKGARWLTFETAMRGKAPAICGVACLKAWTLRRDEPAPAEDRR
jgi:hypothetical protein